MTDLIHCSEKRSVMIRKLLAERNAIVSETIFSLYKSKIKPRQLLIKY